MTNNKYKLRAIACAVVLFSSTLPGLSAAQVTGYATPGANAQRLLSAPPGVDEGMPWGLYGSIGISAHYESNVQRAADGGDDDVGIIIPASLTYRQRVGRHQGHLRFSTQLGRYDTLSTEDFNDFTIDGAFRFDFTHRFDANLFASYTQSHEKRGTTGTPVVQLGDVNKVEIVSYGGDIAYGRKEAKVNFAVGANKDEWRYTNNNQEIRDRDYENVYARAGYRVGAKTDVFVLVRHSDIQYLQSPLNRDSTEKSIWVGGSWRATQATRASVSVGKTDKDFDNPEFEDVDTTEYVARLGWQPHGRHRFDFDAARTTEEGTGLAPYFVSQLFGLRWNYNFANNWNFSAYGSYIEDDFNTGRLDETTEYGVGLNKALFSWLSLTAGYSYIEKTSNFPGAEYDANVITLGLSAQAGTSIDKLLLGPGVE